MKKTFFLVFFSALITDCTLVSALGLSRRTLSKDYQLKSAADKKEELFDKVRDEKGKTGKYPSTIPLLVWSVTPKNKDYVIDHAYDERHKKLPGPRLSSKKIHSVGNVALVNYESVGDHTYTGIFKGTEHALIRLSLAIEVKDEHSTAPGFALKFFRDGMKSANLMAMYSINGQRDKHDGQVIDNEDVGNFFANEFSNHIPDHNPKSPRNTPVKILSGEFAKVSSPPTMVGLSDVGKYTVDGKEELDLNFPCALFFKPNPMLTAKFNGTSPLTPLNDYLSTINPGTMLYEVLAIESPTAEKVLIGKVTTKSELISSEYGDKELFFQHQDINEDFVLRPEWNNTNVRKNFCPFSKDGVRTPDAPKKGIFDRILGKIRG